MAKRQFHGNVSSYLKVIDPNSLPHHQKSNISKLQIVGALKGSNLNYEFLTTLIKTWPSLDKTFDEIFLTLENGILKIPFSKVSH